MPDERAPERDVVISSRVRLARNYGDLPFSPQMDAETTETVIDRALRSMEGRGEYTLLRMRDLPESERRRLVEHHLISYDLLKFSERAAALISQSQTVSVMLGEEDHLRIQGLLPGLQLESAAELAFSLDDALSTGGMFAFDAQWGYLTSCPTNTGTGMRASTMLHLPALHESGQMSGVVQSLAKLGMTVRGLYGEGSDASGHLYQLSNQVTLGRTEEDIIRSLIAATLQLAGHERAVRGQMMESDALLLSDKLMRSVGLLRASRLMPAGEFMARVSDLRLAAALGLIDMKFSEIDAMLKALQPGSLKSVLGEDANTRAIDEARAAKLRAFLKNY